jgi:2-hydroxychromene-2-carboxylate isomerase
MRGAIAAELEGVFRPYVDAVFRAMWEQERKMDDQQVVRKVLDDAGLDGARLLARTQEQEVKDQLLRNTQLSVERGTFGAPTFLVGNEIFLGKDRLREAEEAIVTAHRALPASGARA